MSEHVSSLDNYPDILGYITNNVRANVGVLQLATTLRPRVAMAGRPLEMLLMMQNASDIALEVTVTLRLPQTDAKGQRGRFKTKAERLIIKLQAAAVGLVTLPLLTLPDTAVGSDYKIGMEIKIDPKSTYKPNRIRHAQGGGEVRDELLAETHRELIANLKKMTWTAHASAMTLESNLTIMSGKVGSFADLEPSWTNLWSIADYQDETFLLHRYSHVISAQLLPPLKRGQILPVIQEYTHKRFAEVGYRLADEELDVIARFLTLILEYANPNEKEALFLEGMPYNVRQYFDADGNLLRTKSVVQVPHWLNATVKVFNHDPRTAQYPIKAIAHFAYDDLLKDAMLLGFDKVEQILNIEVGTREERLQYIEHFFTELKSKKLTFDLLYMPLILGALATTDTVVLKNERSQDVVKTMRTMLDGRNREQTPESQPIYDMANQLLSQTSSKYSMSDF